MRTWGGRFSGDTDARVADFTRSIEVDAALAADDIAGSIAHVRGLGRAGLLTADEVETLTDGLLALADDAAAGTHRLGPGARGRPHEPRGGPRRQGRAARRAAPHRAARATTRSRRTCGSGRAGRSTTSTPPCSPSSGPWSSLAEREGTAVLPGTTHIQPAQPVLFAHHLLAYVEMAERDRGRLADARARVDVSPLGSGALAGAGYPLDREATAARARLRWRHRELARRGLGPRLRRRGARRGRARHGPPQPPGRGDHVVVEPAVRVRRASPTRSRPAAR